MKIQTEQGRTVNSALEEFDLGSAEVKNSIEQWKQLLDDDSGAFPVIEKQVHRAMMHLADLVVAGLLAEAGAEEPCDAQIEAVREQALEAGNPLKAPMRKYSIKAALLGGLVLCMRVVYCPPADKRTLNQLIAKGMLSDDTSIKGVHVELNTYAFGKGCSPGLQDEISRTVCLLPSMELARKELARKGVDMEIKQIRRIGYDTGFEMLGVRLQRMQQWKAGTLPQGQELKGMKVAVAIDGGRVRFRSKMKKRKKGKKGSRTTFEPVWREPKLLIIYIMDENGKKDREASFWIDATFQKADHVMELLAMHLHRLGAKDALSIEFVSDGAPWIWNRLNWVIEKAGLDPSKVTRVLDFWHAAHHISLTLEKLGIPEEQRKAKYQAMRRELRQGRWSGIVAELERLAEERQLDPEHEAYQGINYLRTHGETEHLQYLLCKRRRISRGSGAIESTIRRVINLRMKGNGIFWREENAEAFMLMRAHLLSEQWENEMAAMRKRRQTTGGTKTYQWEAEDILQSVKLDEEESLQSSKIPEISALRDCAA